MAGVVEENNVYSCKLYVSFNFHHEDIEVNKRVLNTNNHDDFCNSFICNWTVMLRKLLNSTFRYVEKRGGSVG
jgi:hypothetical protein